MPKGEKSFHHAGKERAALLAAAAVFSVVRRRGTNNSKLRILMSPFFKDSPKLCIPSTPNIDIIGWHRQLIVCAVKWQALPRYMIV